MLRLKQHLKKLIFPGLLITGLISFSFREDLFQASKNLDIFSALYKELNISYVDDVNSSNLMEIGIDAMLNSLDPYTEFVPESDIEDYKMKYVSTQYGGIGTITIPRDGRVTIAETLEGFPAQKADIRAGDEIVEVNGVPLKGKKYEQVSQLLKGPKNTPLKLIVKRYGQNIEKNLNREEITQPNVSYSAMLDNNIGYIKLDKFLESSAKEVQDALIQLQKNNPSGIILDLRSNGGGILQEAVKIVNLFVEPNVIVVTQKGKNREKTIPYKTYNQPIAPTTPLVVLVNNRAASASEIVAGSLQDLDRAVVIGQRSYGKGLVQQTFNLPYNSLIKVTVAKYYTPSGRCIQALDYTHRTTDGSVEKVADSLITEYKTKGNRSVYDGSGIYPDMLVPALKLSPISQTLLSRHYIFDYATLYRKNNATIPEVKLFKITDAEYADFINYLADKDYNYSTRTERVLIDLKAEAEKDRKLSEIKAEYEALKNKVVFSKKNDLTQFKEEIRKLLESEIVTRYYFQKGKLENNFKYDEDLKAAYSVLGNKSTLAAILQGTGSYKSIGKPGSGFSANAGTN
ncbi:MAG: S41 family peptidase [Pyrinomonadaceae bacterium]|nr:S41 family peptidase [Sphingobacteriaceae bacterium]